MICHHSRLAPKGMVIVSFPAWEKEQWQECFSSSGESSKVWKCGNRAVRRAGTGGSQQSRASPAGSNRTQKKGREQISSQAWVIMERKRIPGRSEPVCYRLRRQWKLLEGEQKLIPTESAQCSASEGCWGFFPPKLFINPFHPLKLDFHLRKMQNLEVPTQHTLQALLQPLQFVFCCDSVQRLVILSLPQSLADLGASHSPECWWCANSTCPSEPHPSLSKFTVMASAGFPEQSPKYLDFVWWFSPLGSSRNSLKWHI